MKEKGFKREKKPWPTKDAMEQIYEKNLWGSDQSGFYSGIGSHDPELVDPYVKVVSSFLNSFQNPLVVCDLGCGDFNVGKEFVRHTKKYIAVDIVDQLIKRNKEKFNQVNLEFRCMDIVSDALPSGDCAILRHVLQHLSNAEVKQIVGKINGFKYLILTEHLPEGEFELNKEIISGQGIRLKKQSGIDLLARPFNLNVKEAKQLLSVPAKDSDGVISTMLYRMF